MSSRIIETTDLRDGYSQEEVKNNIQNQRPWEYPRSQPPKSRMKKRKNVWTNPESNRGPLPLTIITAMVKSEVLREHYTTKPYARPYVLSWSYTTIYLFSPLEALRGNPCDIKTGTKTKPF